MNDERAQSQSSPYSGLVQVAFAAVFALAGVAIYVCSPTWTRPFAPHYIGFSLTMSGFTLMVYSYVIFEPNTARREQCHRVIGYLAVSSGIAMAALVANTLVSGDIAGGLAAQFADFLLKSLSN